MNNLRKSALKRWEDKLNKDFSKIPRNRQAILFKSALCGFLAGDGSVQVRKGKGINYYLKYQLDFYPDDKEMLDTYLEFVNEVYSLRPTVKRKGKMYTARTSQKVIVSDLMNLCNFGIYNWDFPLGLFKIRGAKENWLRAFFSAEGYVGKKVIKIQSVNLKSIKKVREMLSDLKIKSNYFEYYSKNKNHSPVGMLFINERKSRIVFYKKIGFWHKRKNKILKKTLGL